MRIFIRNVPDSSSKDDIASFVEGVIQPHWYLPLRVSGLIDNCSVLRVKNLDTGSVEYHGVAEVVPELTAFEAIVKLNGRRLKGRVVEVRKWYERSLFRDRRRLPHDEATALVEDPPARERRLSDRRRPHLLIEAV